MLDDHSTTWNWRDWAFTLDDQGPFETGAATSEPGAEGPPPDFPRYEVLRCLGSGAMGTVWLVRDRELMREVALKLGHKADERTLGQYALEAQISSQLDHPNIPPVYDVGRDDEGRPYLTSKLIRGHEPLKSVIDRLVAADDQAVRCYGYSRRVQVALRIAAALGYAHERCVVHQDVKPENALVGVHNEVYLVDWGVANIEALSCSTNMPVRVGGAGLEEVTYRASEIAGTPAYMAPELFHGQRPDALSDQYSFAATLYELLTLRHYLSDAGTLTDLASIALAAKGHPPKPAHEVDLGCGPPPPKALSAICARGLAKARADRFPSMDAFYDALQGWLDDRGSEA
ncbi:MAG: serine/threonine-protein kinase [Planctomycetota bacterium]